jgi:hypothetical protein
MQKKFIMLFSILGLTAFAANAQSIPEKIEKLSKDPKTAENAAKADVYIHRQKRVIMDTTQKDKPVEISTKNQKSAPSSGKQ